MLHFTKRTLRCSRDVYSMKTAQNSTLSKLFLPLIFHKFLEGIACLVFENLACEIIDIVCDCSTEKEKQPPCPRGTSVTGTPDVADCSCAAGIHRCRRGEQLSGRCPGCSCVHACLASVHRAPEAEPDLHCLNRVISSEFKSVINKAKIYSSKQIKSICIVLCS